MDMEGKNDDLKQNYTKKVVEPQENQQHKEEIKRSFQHNQEQDLQQQVDNASSSKYSSSEAFSHQSQNHKISDDHPQPSCSFHISGRQQSTDYSEVNVKSEDFIKYLVKEFEAKLHAYHLILEGEAKKAGKFSDVFSEIVGQGVGVATGGIAGLILGLPIAGARLGGTAGKTVAGKLGSNRGNKKHTKKVTKVSDLIDISQEDKTNFRRALVEAGFDIFQSFEMQFMRVTSDQGPKKAIQQLAKDATNRAINYHIQKKDALITEGVLLGESKIESVLGVPIATSKIKTPGFEINYNYKSSQQKWYTANLYEKVGLVIEGKTIRELPSYYEKKDGKSRTDKYGYRRLLTSESWEKLKDKYRSSNLEKSIQFTDYQYILSSRDLEQKTKDILKKINQDDEGLAEERIKKIIQETKDDIIEELNLFKKQSHRYKEEHRELLESIKANLNSLNVNEYWEKFKQCFDISTEEHHKIAKFIQVGQEESKKKFNQLNQKLDIHHDDNKREHKKTQQGIQGVKEGIEDYSKKICEIHEVIVTHKDKQKEESILFDVKNTVRLFTGRKEELRDLHSKIQRSAGKPTVISQMTSISGLGGIGKTELARKYIYEHGKDYDNNIIWINADNEGTLIESFHRLAKDKLEIRTKDADGTIKNIKSIVEEVYTFFSKKKCLFIFDNAEKSGYLNKFLPLYCFMPDANKPYILITSRNQEWEDGIEMTMLKELKQEEAIQFVKEGLSISDESQDKEIKKLVKKLQYFPLAIQQAIAYIKYQMVTKDYEIGEYLNEYEEKTKELLDSKLFQGIDNSYTKTTFTTWKITLDKISSDKEYGQLALKVLDFIAYFAPEKIYREIFLKLTDGNEEQLRSAIRLLVKYSMVNGEEKQSIISIHRLVQEVMRLELRDTGMEEENLKQVLRLIERNLEKKTLDHAISVYIHASKYNELVQEFNRLPGCITSQLHNNKRYEEGYWFGEKALMLTTRVLGLFHPSISNTQRNVVALFNRQKKIQEDFKEYMCLYKKLVEEKNINKTPHLVDLELTESSNVMDNQNRTLLSSAENDHLGTVKHLTDEKQTNSSLQKDNSYTPLHVATINGKLDKVKYLINEEKADFNVVDKQGNTLLHFATVFGYLDIVKYFLNYKMVDANILDNHRSTPLHFAAFFGHLDTVKYLIHEKKADFNAQNDFDLSPLQLASINGKLDTVKYLIDQKKSDFNVKYVFGKNLLHLATENGHLDIAKYLIEEKRAKINVRNIFGSTPSHFAAENGHFDTVKYLIDEKKADFNLKDILGNTPLHLAAKNGHLNTVKYLIDDKKANFIVPNIHGRTPLHLASENGELDTVKYLIEVKKTDFNLLDKRGYTSLHLAAMNGHLDTVKYLIEEKNDDYNTIYSNGTSSNLMDQICYFPETIYLDKIIGNLNVMYNDGLNPLHWAALNGHLDTVKYLIEEKNAKFDVRNNNGYTPLHFAAKNGHLETVKYLIDEKEADINVINKKHETSLHLAAENGHLPTVKYLIDEKWADLNAMDKEGCRPLHFAAKNGHLQTIKYLIDEKEADIDVINEEGCTPLHFAAESGHQDIVRYLINEKKVNVNVRDKYGNTPLHLSAVTGKLNTIKCLIDEIMADFNVTNILGHTPLHIAAETDLNIVKYLIDEKKADFNVRDKRGKSPLHFSAKRGELDIIKYLIDEKKADFNARDYLGHTPLYLAYKGGHSVTVNYLMNEKKADFCVTDVEGIAPLLFVAVNNLYFILSVLLPILIITILLHTWLQRMDTYN